jgi:multiple sugar transport system permease protein
MSTMTSAGTSAGTRSRRSGPQRAEARWGWIFAAPGTVHTLIWIGAPVIVALILSFTSYDIIHSPTFNGLSNYVLIFHDRLFWKSALNNLIIAVIGIPISMLIAMIVAVLLNTKVLGRGIFRTMIFLPHITATVAVAMVWLWIYAPSDSGLMNTILGFFGVPTQAYLTNVSIALPSIILVTIWQGVGLKMLIYLASLQGIDPALYEAADIDGGGVIAKFRYITVPMLRPSTFFVLVTSIIANFQTFDLIYILTSGGPANATSVITYRIYQTAFQEFRMGLASAQSIILMIILAILTFFSNKVVGGTDND